MRLVLLAFLVVPALAGCAQPVAEPAPIPVPASSGLIVDEFTFNVTTRPCEVGAPDCDNLVAPDTRYFPVRGTVVHLELDATWDAINPNEEQLRFRIMHCRDGCSYKFSEVLSSPAHLEGDLEAELGQMRIWVGVDYAGVAGGFAGTGTEIHGVIRFTQDAERPQPSGAVS